jgi:hypothetical protein
MLQSLPLGLDAEDCLHDPAGDHECGADEIAEGDLGDVPEPEAFSIKAPKSSGPAMPPAAVPIA